MRALSIDYLRTPRSLRWVGMVILVAGGVASAGFVQQYRDLQLELSRVQMTAGLLNVERIPASAASARGTEEELKQVNVMIYQLTLPWGEIFAAVENAATPQVALLQVQPDAQQRLLKITAEAKDQGAMLQYVRRLSDARNLSNVHLLSHQVQVQDPLRPIQFSVQANFGVKP